MGKEKGKEEKRIDQSLVATGQLRESLSFLFLFSSFASCCVVPYCCSANDFFFCDITYCRIKVRHAKLMRACFFLVDLLLSPDSSLSSEGEKIAVVVESIAEKD